MKIGRKEDLNAEEMRAIQQGSQNRAKANPAATSIITGENEGPEKIDVSRGALLAQMMSSGTSDVDHQRRLEAIQRKVNDGSYLSNINSMAVAAKLEEDIGLEIASIRSSGLLDE